VTDDLPPQSIWLFTRESESVRLCVQPGPAGFQLAIFGPGNASAEVDFAELENLERFREKYRRDLLARGFEAHTATDRRQGTDRRLMPRPSAVERRR
jgi:hypothetical protein